MNKKTSVRFLSYFPILFVLFMIYQVGTTNAFGQAFDATKCNAPKADLSLCYKQLVNDLKAVKGKAEAAVGLMKKRFPQEELTDLKSDYEKTQKSLNEALDFMLASGKSTDFTIAGTLLTQAQNDYTAFSNNANTKLKATPTAFGFTSELIGWLVKRGIKEIQIYLNKRELRRAKLRDWELIPALSSK